MVLTSGWIRRAGLFALSSQRDAPGVVHPMGRAGIAVSFGAPIAGERGRFEVDDGTRIRRRSWSGTSAFYRADLERVPCCSARLRFPARPFLRVGTITSTHHENGRVFQFELQS